MEEAFKFIDKSKELKLFATKFQIFNEDNIKDSPPEYQEFLKSIMLDISAVKILFEYGKSIEQEVFFTPMFLEAVDWCENIGVNYYKIRFKDNQNIELIKKIEATNKPFFYSINIQLKPLTNKGINLYCNPHYPSVPSNYNSFFKKELYFNGWGISDHCKGINLLKKALNYNVQYLEKHIMINRTQPLEEKWSSTFNEIYNIIYKNTKMCIVCNKIKKIEEFYYIKIKKKYENRCKKCQNELCQDWYNRNKFNRFQYLNKRRNHYNELNKQLHKKNKEKRDLQLQEWKDNQIIKVEGIKSLSSLHRFVKRHKLKPKYCEICNEIKPLELASINHIYTRNPEDYFYLCKSCHAIYDKNVRIKG